MPACIIAWVKITDRNLYRKYLEAAPAIIRQYSGRVIARSEEPVTLEGPAEHRKIIIGFPPVARAREFYDSPEYQKARKLREHAGTGELIIVDGFGPGLFDGDHSFEILERPERGVVFTQRETFSGLRLPFLSRVLADTENEFHRMNTAIRSPAETAEQSG